MGFNTLVPIHNGRLYSSDGDAKGLAGNWVRLAEVNRLEDEIRRLEKALRVQEQISRMHEIARSRMDERINELQQERDSMRRGVLAQLVPGSSSQ